MNVGLSNDAIYLLAEIKEIYYRIIKDDGLNQTTQYSEHAKAQDKEWIDTFLGLADPLLKMENNLQALKPYQRDCSQY